MSALFPFQDASLSRRRLLSSSAFAGVGLAGAALVGCGSDDDDDNEADAATAGTTAQASATASASAAASSAAIPAEFVIANEAEPADLMPFFGGFGPALILRAINETLLRIRMTLNAEGIAEVEYVPMLAESWEHPDDTTFTFKLRPGVTFHDGEEWNAEAAKVAFDAQLDAAAVQALNKSPILAGSIASVDVVDPMTIGITSTAPMSFAEFAGIGVYLGYSAFSPRAFADGGVEGMAENPVGTGPYRFESWERGQDLVLVRNEDYWGTLPNMERLRFITCSEASVRAQTVKTGEAHFAFNIGAEQATALDHSIVGGGFQSNSLRLNNQKAPTSDIRIRRAINFAIDRQGINDALFNGTATPISYFAYQPVHIPVWPYDPEEAKRLVDEAGMAGEEIELVYGEFRVPEEDQLAEIFKAQIEQSGLRVSLTRVETRQYDEISGADPAQQPTMLMETTSSGNYGESSGSLLDKYGCEGSGTFCVPELDTRYENLRVLEGEERLAEVQDIATLLGEEHAPRAWVLAINQVHGLAPNVEADLPLNVYPHWADFRFV